MFDGDSSSHFLGDEASFQKKEADLAKRLVSMDLTMKYYSSFTLNVNMVASIGNYV